MNRGESSRTHTPLVLLHKEKNTAVFLKAEFMNTV
jgi:hypothetical protein